MIIKSQSDRLSKDDYEDSRNDDSRSESALREWELRGETVHLARRRRFVRDRDCRAGFLTIIESGNCARVEREGNSKHKLIEKQK